MAVYVPSTKYVIIISSSSQLVLILSVESNEAVIFSYASGQGYYLSSYVQSDIIAFITASGDLRARWNYFRAHGTYFRITLSRQYQGSIQINIFFRRFFVLFIGRFELYTLTEWRSTSIAIYQHIGIIVCNRNGSYVIGVDEYYEFIRALIAGEWSSGCSGGGSTSTTTTTTTTEGTSGGGGSSGGGSDESRSAGHNKGTTIL